MRTSKLLMAVIGITILVSLLPSVAWAGPSNPIVQLKEGNTIYIWEFDYWEINQMAQSWWHASEYYAHTMVWRVVNDKYGNFSYPSKLGIVAVAKATLATRLHNRAKELSPARPGSLMRIEMTLNDKLIPYLQAIDLVASVWMTAVGKFKLYHPVLGRWYWTNWQPLDMPISVP
ncbi:MAG: hypothetical protein FJ011_18090 [Chloroflexi bacterium]|nr:hypothetical protein [Chloroflexota bacterium]